MGFAEYANYDGVGLAELVKRKEVKPTELVEAAIERVERHNPQLNAVVFKAYEEARAKATVSLSGAFAGVPMLLKDLLGDKKGWPTRRGSRFVPAAPSHFDATLVSRFEAAGLVPLGKTNASEHGAVHRAEALRSRTQSLEFRAFDRRFIGWIGGGGGRRRSARACQ